MPFHAVQESSQWLFIWDQLSRLVENLPWRLPWLSSVLFCVQDVYALIEIHWKPFTLHDASPVPTRTSRAWVTIELHTRHWRKIRVVAFRTMRTEPLYCRYCHFTNNRFHLLSVRALLLKYWWLQRFTPFWFEQNLTLYLPLRGRTSLHIACIYHSMLCVKECMTDTLIIQEYSAHFHLTAVPPITYWWVNFF